MKICRFLCVISLFVLQFSFESAGSGPVSKTCEPGFNVALVQGSVFDELLPRNLGDKGWRVENFSLGDISVLNDDPAAKYYRQDRSSMQGTSYIADPLYIDEIARLGRLLHMEYPRFEKIPIVLYIASGTDAAIAHKIFSPKISVGVDNHPFWDESIKENSKLDVYPITGTIFRYSTDLDYKEEQILAPKLVGSFAAHIQGFRIRKLVLFNTKEKNKEESEAVSDNMYCGLLVFDSGPDTEIRAHLQIQAPRRTDIDVTKIWWFRNVVEKFGNRIALIEKASDGAFRGEENKMRGPLIDHISRNRGVWIEGTVSNEVDPSKREWGFSTHSGFAQAREVQESRWGYSNLIRIVTFD